MVFTRQLIPTSPMTTLRTPAFCFALLVLATCPLRAAAPGEPGLKTEHFDHDPGWEGYNNHIVPANAKIMKQDFGYSSTSFAGKAKGEIGGTIQRASKPAFYAAPLAPAKTLEDKLSASGSFAIPHRSAGGVFFGFFNSQQPGASGRPIGSLGLDLNFASTGGRLAVRLISNGNQSCGTFITPYLPGKFRPALLKADGTRYHWTLDYDPQGAGGNGRFTFTMVSDTHKTQDYGPLPEDHEKEARARFPFTTTFTVDLPPEIRKEGATFDRFGLCNTLKDGGSATIYFADLQFNGKTEDFAQDPGWIGVGNRETYENTEQGGAQNFGYQPTALAGGAPGEIGGLVWRSPYAYYADRVGPFCLKDRLEARGRVVLKVGAPDSGMMLGWFNSEVKKTDDKAPFSGRNFVGVAIGGPTRVGHYFLPTCVTIAGGRAEPKSGPVLKQGKVYEWTFVYDPATNDGHGQLRVTLGSESVILDLGAGQKPENVLFDRFGLFGIGTGGGQVKVYFDDLTYSAAKP